MTLNKKILSIVLTLILVLSNALFSNQTLALAQKDNIKLKVFEHFPKNEAGTKGKVISWCTKTTNDQVADYILFGDHMPLAGITYRINYSTKPKSLSQTQIDQAVKSATNTWTVADPNEKFNYDGSTTAVASKYDGINTISWSRLNSQAIAITYSWYNASTKELTEVDTVYNTKYQWSYTTYTGSNDCSGVAGTYDLQDLATHEFGHWVGLDDLYNQADKDLTMYGYADTQELKKGSLGNGDIMGVRAVLP